MQPIAFFALFAGSAMAIRQVPGCHYWIREVATGANIAQGCVGKGWTVAPWVGTGYYTIKADQNCKLVTEGEGKYIGQGDGECTADVPGKLTRRTAYLG